MEKKKKFLHEDTIWSHVVCFLARRKEVLEKFDKDADGRINEEEIKDIISLSATANKLSNIQKQAEEYAALIMEELDPDDT